MRYGWMPTYWLRRGFISVRWTPKLDESRTSRDILKETCKDWAREMAAIATPDVPPEIFKAIRSGVNESLKGSSIDCTIISKKPQIIDQPVLVLYLSSIF